ncbi:hypothetical protein F4604DRAFT_1927790 [Suillus subluteus]|nr:hypothetical protein F4604DRAFT_1927785 [Suillus subluteus]KAG1866818.1 hypothetical protein F4604DRAFT_1927790 [Suillus subluteus]
MNEGSTNLADASLEIWERGASDAVPGPAPLQEGDGMAVGMEDSIVSLELNDDFAMGSMNLADASLEIWERGASDAVPGPAPLQVNTDAHILIHHEQEGDGMAVGMEDSIVSLEPNDDFAMGAPRGAPGAMDKTIPA